MGRLHTARLSAKLANATLFIPLANNIAEGCSSRVAPEVSLCGGPMIVNLAGEKAILHRFVLSPDRPEKTSPCLSGPKANFSKGKEFSRSPVNFALRIALIRPVFIASPDSKGVTHQSAVSSLLGSGLPRNSRRPSANQVGKRAPAKSDRTCLGTRPMESTTYMLAFPGMLSVTPPP